MTTGFPRLRNLVTNNRSHNNVSRLYLKKEFAFSEESAVRAARHLKSISLDQVIVRRTCLPMSTLTNQHPWFQLWRDVYQPALFADEHLHLFLPFVGQLELNRAATFGLCTTPHILQHICGEIHKQFAGLIAAVASPSHLSVPEILVFVTNDAVHTNTKVAHNMDPDAYVKKIMREMPELIDVNGVQGVLDVFVRGGPHSATATDDYMVQQGFVSKDEYFVETNGGDLVECCVAAGEFLDERRSLSFNPAYTMQTFGIEACRQVMLNELRKVLADTSHVDEHHVTLLVDCMLQTGQLVSVTRQSQQKVRFSGVLDIATFEQGIKVMTSAAQRRVRDNLQGTSARIAVGQPVQAGTGMFKLVYPTT